MLLGGFMDSMTNAAVPLQTAANALAQNAVNTDLLKKVASADSANKIIDNAESSIVAVDKASETEVDEALDIVNKAAVFEQRSLSFMMDEASGRSIIKVIDRSTEQLIRQIPSEELLKVAQDIKRLQEEMGQSIGFLVDRQV